MAIQPKAPSQQQPKPAQQSSTQQPAQQGQNWKQGQTGHQSNLGQQDKQKGVLDQKRSGQAQKGQVNQNDMENQADI